MDPIFASALRGHVRAERIKLPKVCYQRSLFWTTVFGARPFVWMAVALVLTGLSGWPGWAAWPAAALCLLLAQRHFQTLVHDASHAFYHRKAHTNDALANWLAAGWIGMTVENYRRIHLQHHAHNGSADDPEHVSFASVAESGGMLRMILRYACLLEALRLVRKYYGAASRAENRSKAGGGNGLRGKAHIIGTHLIFFGFCLALAAT